MSAFTWSGLDEGSAVFTRGSSDEHGPRLLLKHQCLHVTDVSEPAPGQPRASAWEGT